MVLPTQHSHSADNPVEKLQGSIERVTFHSESSGFCVLRIKVKGYRELITVLGSADTVTAGDYSEYNIYWLVDGLRKISALWCKMFAGLL